MKLRQQGLIFPVKTSGYDYGRFKQARHTQAQTGSEGGGYAMVVSAARAAFVCPDHTCLGSAAAAIDQSLVKCFVFFATRRWLRLERQE